MKIGIGNGVMWQQLAKAEITEKREKQNTAWRRKAKKRRHGSVMAEETCGENIQKKCRIHLVAISINHQLNHRKAEKAKEERKWRRKK
jgi:hypothetical protein